MSYYYYIYPGTFLGLSHEGAHPQTHRRNPTADRFKARDWRRVTESKREHSFHHRTWINRKQGEEKDSVMARDELSAGAFLLLLELWGLTEQQVKQLLTRAEIKNKNKTLSRT